MLKNSFKFLVIIFVVMVIFINPVIGSNIDSVGVSILDSECRITFSVSEIEIPHVDDKGDFSSELELNIRLTLYAYDSVTSNKHNLEEGSEKKLSFQAIDGGDTIDPHFSFIMLRDNLKGDQLMLEVKIIDRDVLIRKEDCKNTIPIPFLRDVLCETTVITDLMTGDDEISHKEFYFDLNQEFEGYRNLEDGGRIEVWLALSQSCNEQ